MGKLDGRVAIITGSGRGIGRATALTFAREGAKIVVATRTAAPGREVVDEIVAGGGEALLVALDLGDRAAVRDLIDQTVARFGRIDIVLHNAASLEAASLADMPDEGLDAMFDLSVKACFWLTKDALPWLKRSPAGRILVTSSVAGNHSSIPMRVAYGSAKMAVTGFVRGAGLELSRLGITVNAIEPGLTLTPSLERNADPETIAMMSANIPIPRPAHPDEIAAGFLYFASDEAAYVTGQSLCISGGSTLGNVQGLPFD